MQTALGVLRREAEGAVAEQGFRSLITSAQKLQTQALTPPWGKINLRLRCSVVKNPPASEGNPGSIPGPGGSHVQCSN